ncbi:pyridoxamine 5'-phosphate oxidase family protein [Alteromonadaceae bacterium BrNp21-10]|nr:pyridoxamine 5'-phosphate oxidase family protein [Alteromonadaceae bacterium BrNp21-10]
MDDKYKIKNEMELESIIGPPMDVKAKILTQLDDLMKEFIRKSPLVFIATIDANGHVDVSPKGDPCGFIEIDASGNLLIPDRPGNRLTFGFRNILRNGEIGLIFLAPNQRETLRVKGVATLHNDPDVLHKLHVNNKPALLCTYVEVKECFMHCGKALVRSKLWQPQYWDTSTDSIGAKQLAPALGGDAGEGSVQRTKEMLDKAYTDELY